MQTFIFALGNIFVESLAFLGGLGVLVKQSAKELFQKPFYPGLVIEQVNSIGNRSLSLVIVTALSTGMVIALQFGLGLEKFGGKPYVPKLSSLSFVRELGPVFTSLMVAARVGAGIASEIGSMTVTQQIDAIRALGTSPIKRVVIPRILATLIAVPALTVIANTIGVLGALMVGMLELGLDPGFFMQKVFDTVKLMDYLVGFGKTFFFAFFISVIGCYFGLTVKEGTRGVGIATTKSVVASSICILISDFFLTKLFFIIERWAQ
jgi:phospholipid/cholesterol/gamma-HCH transport system permease protein